MRDTGRPSRMLARSEATISRRAFLGALTGLAVGASSVGRAALARASKAWSLEEFAGNIQSGGPPKDGIPPIDRPKYVPAAEATKFLRDTDVVFGLERAGDARAYPQKVLVWHEIVNDEVAGERLSVTYCPLTGSAVGFRGRSRGDGAALTFGTSGKLVNSNLLMYDRQTDSQWPQILGVAITGPNEGVALEEFSLVWTTWDRWRRTHPETRVLSTATGFLRTYGSDPYGSYDREGTYYQSGGPFFPVMATDRRFSPKHVVVGVKAEAATLAISKTTLERQQVINTSLGDVPLVALYDEPLKAARVFRRHAAKTTLRFRRDGDRLVDVATGSLWTATGRCREGRLSGTQLPVIAAYDVMWFAWAAFYPQTAVWEAGKA